MDIKQLKKLINEEVAKIKMQEATNPGTPKAKIKAAASLAPIEPSVTTVMKPMPRDPAVAPPSSKQPISKSSYQNPKDVYYGLRRMKIELLTKFEIEMKDEEASQIIRDIFDQEVNKLTSKHPELDVE